MVLPVYPRNNPSRSSTNILLGWSNLCIYAANDDSYSVRAGWSDRNIGTSIVAAVYELLYSAVKSFDVT